MHGNTTAYLFACHECIFHGVILACHDYLFDNIDMLLDRAPLFCLWRFECVRVVRILEKNNMCIADVWYFLSGRDLISDAGLW